MTKEEQLDHLQELITVAKDSELGYRTAAEHVGDPHLAGIFREYAGQRAKFVEDLAKEVTRILGDVPAEHGTAMGAVFRGWMSVKSALTDGGALAMVAACETGEDSAEAAYERVVNLEVSGNLRSLAESQWNKIREAHHRMLNLKAQLAGDPHPASDAVSPATSTATSHGKSH